MSWVLSLLPCIKNYSVLDKSYNWAARCHTSLVLSSLVWFVYTTWLFAELPSGPIMLSKPRKLYIPNCALCWIVYLPFPPIKLWCYSLFCAFCNLLSKQICLITVQILSNFTWLYVVLIKKQLSNAKLKK